MTSVSRCQPVKLRATLGGMATNREVAAKIGLTHSGISRIRSGGRVPLSTTMLAIEREYSWKLEEQSRAAAEGRYAAEFEVHVMAHADPASSIPG